MDPRKLKYQLIWFTDPEVQSRAGVTPAEALKAEVN